MNDVRKLQSVVLDAAGDAGSALCDSTSDTISATIDNSIDQTDQQKLSKEHNQQQIQSWQTIHQTTQSLLIASSMLVGTASKLGGRIDNNTSCNINNNNNSAEISSGNNRFHDGHYTSENTFCSADSMNGHLFPMALNVGATVLHQKASNEQNVMNRMSNVKTVQINIHDLVIENQSLREKLKEVTADRDRLLCEVSNLRLELDMFELKRLPEER